MSEVCVRIALIGKFCQNIMSDMKPFLQTPTVNTRFVRISFTVPSGIVLTHSNCQGHYDFCTFRYDQ